MKRCEGPGAATVEERRRGAYAYAATIVREVRRGARGQSLTSQDMGRGGLGDGKLGFGDEDVCTYMWAGGDFMIRWAGNYGSWGCLV